VQLEPGTRLGPYEIIDRVGAGGMGDVYRARDTRLSRNVAIKVLAERFAARFEREAKAISALNHPNICTLHDVGRENGVDYLVLEFCEGQTLAQRLERGPLPAADALRYGVEIAEALSRAHRSGIVHRDLKPSNIMLTKSGVKLLDFGLAKQNAPSNDDRTTSLHGRIAGTVQYMAPEVIAGGEATAQSDIFALGLVLHEMITGQPAFAGTSTAGVMAAILEHEPLPLPPDTAPALDHVIRKCLSKNPEERRESAHDIAEELRWIRDARPAPLARPRRLAMFVAGGIAALALLAFVTYRLTRKADAAPVARLSITLPPGTDAPSSVVVFGGLPNVAISPDGKRIAYAASVDRVRRIYVRPIDSLEAFPLPTTEAFGPTFLHDGQAIAFVSVGKLLRSEVAGGTAQTVINLGGTGRGQTFAADGTMFFSPTSSSGIWRLPPGGAAQQITTLDARAGENSHRWPRLLPDGRHLLFTIRTSQIATFDDAKIAVLSLETGKWNVVLEGGTYGRYAIGHLFFARGRTIYAAPFDLRKMSVTGPRRQVADGVIVTPNSGAAFYDVSTNGDFVYVPGGNPDKSVELLAVDRAGAAKVIAPLPFSADIFRISPDGRKIALWANTANDDIWIYNIASGVTTRLSFEGGDEGHPLWTPDGAHVIYASGTERKVLIKPADGSGEARVLLSRMGQPMSCSPDGALLAFTENDPVTGFDVWVMPLTGAGQPRPLLRTRFDEASPIFSPDGKWIAYRSNETGVREIYIRSASGEGGRWQISTKGGTDPRWSLDGGELFYRNGDDFFGAMLSYTGQSVQPARTQLLFSMPAVRDYNVTKDGFMIERDLSSFGINPQINVVLNLRRELSP
jgi:eukaryotic-like serine/threonine-protein kinase